MQKMMKVFFWVFILSTIVVACDKEEYESDRSDGEVLNFFQAGNEKYSISQGFLLESGQPDDESGTYLFALLLASEGLSIETSTLDITGSGTLVMVVFFSSEPFLTSGEYLYDEMSSYAAYTYFNGIYSPELHYDSETETSVEPRMFYSGKMTVNKLRNGYEFTITNAVDDHALEISGHYKGSVKSVNMLGAIM